MIFKYSRVLQIVFSTAMIIIILFLFPVSDLKKIILSILCAFFFHYISNYFIYLNILKTGIKGKGRIISCEMRETIGRKEAGEILFHGYYKPIVMIEDSHCKKNQSEELWGIFYNPILEGTELLISQDLATGRVVVAENTIQKRYLFYTCVSCSIIISIFIFLFLIDIN